MNNIYVRSNKSIKSISWIRILTLIPLILFGIYKNGIYLFINNLISTKLLFKPILLILGGGLIGALVNIIYEYIFKKSKDNFIEVLFSSFHIEYGLILGMIASINTHMSIYFITIFIILLISKFIKNYINIVSFIFIIIYILEIVLFKNYSYLNMYELNTNLVLNSFDYLIGRGAGGIATTCNILSLISLVILSLTDNTKKNISIYSLSTFLIIFGIYILVSKIDYSILFINSYIFSFIYIATDFVTSSYTKGGTIIYGILVGLLTFIFYLINPILAPFISITIVSLLNVFIDKIGKKIGRK